MSGGGSSTPANTTTSSTTTNNPWGGAKKYLTNDQSTYDPTNGMYASNTDATKPMGAYQQVSNYADQYGTLSPEQQSLIGGQQGTLQDRTGGLTDLYGQNTSLAGQIGGGQYDANFNPIADVNQTQQMQSLGNLDPSQAYQQLLSGTPNNPYLQSMNQGNINQAMRGYQDATDTFMNQFMPSVSNDAFAAGQYGGSRQGVVEGLGAQQMQKNARDLGIAAMDSGNQLFGGAYENAQGRMQGAADTLGNQALQTGQFNANLGIQNNQQLMDMLGFNKTNAVQGNEMQNNAFNTNAAGQDQIFNQLQSLLQMPQDQQQQALSFLLSSINPGAGMGGTQSTTSQQPIYNNTLGQVAGGVAGTAGLLSAMKQ